MRYSNANALFYGVFVTLILLSGLSVPLLNHSFLNETVSVIRIGWVGLLIYIFFKIDWRRAILRSVLVQLFFIWISIHIINFLLLDGDAGNILTRAIQASFITALFLLTIQKKVDLEGFCGGFQPAILAFAWVTLLVYVFSATLNDQSVFFLVQSSVIGVSSNFSIFCAQLFSFFLLRDLHKTKTKKHSSHLSLILLALLTLPILGWQVAASSGRTGIVLTIIAGCGYSFAIDRLKGLLVAFLTLLATILILDSALKYVATIVEFSEALVRNGIGLTRHGGGVFRKVNTLVNVLDPGQNVVLIEAVNQFSSWRVDGLVQTVPSAIP